jgi:acetyl/propionyl-CoA carboxylase alpha subunit
VRRLFIANRGEIARRIATSALRMGIEPVIPRLDGPDGLDLLDAAAVVEAARLASADAVHPGYGFLAESPLLAAAVLDAGLTWVGPSPEAIRSLGDKAAARALARGVDVPVAAGEEPADQSDASLAASAARIGYPVLVKPVAGGGGKGIRVAATEAELAPALASARREAGRAFGDERLLLERFVPDARHVEVQILGDAHGSVVHLGDRDCSLQRRHQKLLEEAPAPRLDTGLRAALWASAVRLGAAAGYTNAGTCEFLVGGDGSFVFLELNARLQVEHPVTELVLGRDLVADQLGIAQGARLADLGLEQAAIEDALMRGGHAIEVRLNAEDPTHGFLPTTGRVASVRWPDGATAFGPVGEAGIRVDAGIAEGDEIGGAYDPLLAKVIAVGADRDEALTRLGAALDATEVLGLTTNLAFLRRLRRVPAVEEGRIRTESVATDADVAAAAQGPLEATPSDAAWRAAAAALVGSAGPVGAWSGGWRANGPARLRLSASWGDEVIERTVEIDAAAAAANSTPLAVEGSGAHVSIDGASTSFRIAPPPDLAAAAERGASARGESLPEVVRAPMPGRVVTVHVRAGDDVAGGDPVATVEAMKMEHVVASPGPARVEEVLVREGEQVERGRIVARLAAPPSETAPA